MEFRSESADIDRINMLFRDTEIEDNGSRTPPGFGDNRKVSSANPEIPLPNMAPNGKMLGANLPTPRRKSEEAIHLDDGSIPHHNKGGKRREDKLKADPKVQALKFEIWRKREFGG